MRAAGYIFVSSSVSASRFRRYLGQEFYIFTTGVLRSPSLFYYTVSRNYIERVYNLALARSINIYLPIVLRRAMHWRML